MVSFSWHQTGPFLLMADPGEPLLLAQGYLSGTAILTIFVRLLLRLPDKLNGPGRKQMHHEETAFRMDIRSGRIDWDLQGTPVLADTVAHLPDRKILLQSVDTAVRQQLTSRWEQAIRGLPVGGSLIFRLTLPGDEHVMICERGLFFCPVQQVDSSSDTGYPPVVWFPLSVRRTTDYAADCTAFMRPTFYRWQPVPSYCCRSDLGSFRFSGTGGRYAGSTLFSARTFGWFLLCESLLTLVASSGATGAKRGIYLFKGGIIGAVALLILSGYSGSNLLGYHTGIYLFVVRRFSGCCRGWFVIRTGDARWLAGCVRSCMRYSFSSPIPLIMMERFLSSSGR